MSYAYIKEAVNYIPHTPLFKVFSFFSTKPHIWLDECKSFYLFSYLNILQMEDCYTTAVLRDIMKRKGNITTMLVDLQGLYHHVLIGQFGKYHSWKYSANYMKNIIKQKWVIYSSKFIIKEIYQDILKHSGEILLMEEIDWDNYTEMNAGLVILFVEISICYLIFILSLSKFMALSILIELNIFPTKVSKMSMILLFSNVYIIKFLNKFSKRFRQSIFVIVICFNVLYLAFYISNNSENFSEEVFLLKFPSY